MAKRYRMRDMSGILHKGWCVCTVLERKTLFGWRQIAERHCDIYQRPREHYVAQHVTDLTSFMEADAKDRVIAEF